MNECLSCRSGQHGQPIPSALCPCTCGCQYIWPASAVEAAADLNHEQALRERFGRQVDGMTPGELARLKELTPEMAPTHSAEAGECCQHCAADGPWHQSHLRPCPIRGCSASETATPTSPEAGESRG